eukprot:CAMPEP_0184327118 /NCGR_PEP_ID=MMETSP1049-20130417/142925_1 /TAXON_ID=77928 /ORGANISM="Proteomonas sulcata, Strain CCMP704" /LENGTH=131 /DNA_ID=CAMNT_0026649355 /DNA_START=780 /DNA_END=1175 /DNA_ORIENTATION=-
MTQVEVFRVQGTKGLLEQAHDMTCDRKFWCHEKARNLHHAHTTKALAAQLSDRNRAAGGRVHTMLQFLAKMHQAQAHDMTCDRKFWCHEKARNLHHAHTTKALAVPPLLAAMGYEPAKGGWELRPNARNFY